MLLVNHPGSEASVKIMVHQLVVDPCDEAVVMVVVVVVHPIVEEVEAVVVVEVDSVVEIHNKHSQSMSTCFVFCSFYMSVFVCVRVYIYLYQYSK